MEIHYGNQLLAQEEHECADQQQAVVHIRAQHKTRGKVSHQRNRASHLDQSNYGTGNRDYGNHQGLHKIRCHYAPCPRNYRYEDHGQPSNYDGHTHICIKYRTGKYTQGIEPDAGIDQAEQDQSHGEKQFILVAKSALDRLCRGIYAHLSEAMGKVSPAAKVGEGIGKKHQANGKPIGECFARRTSKCPGGKLHHKSG